MRATLLIIAKAPVAGRSKTRLCPPCTPQQAADLAAAALADTLDVVAAVRGVARRVLVLDGAPGGWLPPGFDVVPQSGGDLADRIAAAFAVVDGPALLVGMDTPQLTPGHLRRGLDALATHDAALGLAPDGGYWAIGLRRPGVDVFSGVPMSAPDTGLRQRDRIDRAGLRCGDLPWLRDVDTIADAAAVAKAAPHTRFARTFADLRVAA